VGPDYPRALVERRVEGWSVISFRISTSGNVEDAFVSDSSGEAEIDASVLRAVSKWTYEPGSSARCGVQVRLSLQMGVRTGPNKRLERFDEAFAAGDIAAARAIFDDFHANSLRELTQRELMRAHLARASGDIEGELVALERVARAGLPSRFGPHVERTARNRAARADQLSLDAFVATSSRQASALVAARQYGRAAAIVRGLRELGALPAELVGLAEQLDGLAPGGVDLATPGVARRLGASERAPSHWSSPLTRKRFLLARESGEITRAELCCLDAALEFAPDTLIRVPEGASQCQVQIRGSEGARFTLVEPPSSEATASDSL